MPYYGARRTGYQEPSAYTSWNDMQYQARLPAGQVELYQSIASKDRSYPQSPEPFVPLSPPRMNTNANTPTKGHLPHSSYSTPSGPTPRGPSGSPSAHPSAPYSPLPPPLQSYPQATTSLQPSPLPSRMNPSSSSYPGPPQQAIPTPSHSIPTPSHSIVTYPRVRTTVQLNASDIVNIPSRSPMHERYPPILKGFKVAVNTVIASNRLIRATNTQEQHRSGQRSREDEHQFLD